jgi:hypothetical protein
MSSGTELALPLGFAVDRRRRVAERHLSSGRFMGDDPHGACGSSSGKFLLRCSGSSESGRIGVRWQR